MNISKILYIALFCGVLISCGHNVRESETNNRIENLCWLSFGEIKPRGWLLTQMKNDLRNGYVGHLDELVPELIVEDEIYGNDRLTEKIKSKDLGTLASGEWAVQFLWWNSETQSNWRDGWLRNAILTEDTAVLREADTYVRKMLSFQDEDGYMGIYAPDLRFHFTGENGELWAQSTLFRVLLAWYEATGNEEVLTAVEKAVDVTMKAWPVDHSEPFNVQNPYGGVEHGLTLVDALDRLYQLTGKQKYLDFAAWLFEDYNRHSLSQEDIHIKNLLDTSYRFQGHGVHTYEHLHALVIAWKATGNPLYETALDHYLNRLPGYLAPSGSPVGDEFILGRQADASETGYEYCSIQELFDSYSHLLQKKGDLCWGDKMEWLFFNAAQGSRHPHEPSIAYLKTDNSYSMTGTMHPGQKDAHEHNTRYSYSPTHQEAAVCCVPNAGRIPSYFVRNMWMRSDNGLVKTLYGPSTVHTKINDTEIRIEESTDYPFGLKVRYCIETKKPVSFELVFRKPGWCTNINLSVNGTPQDKNRITKKWQTGDTITVRFETTIQQHTDRKGDRYFSYGPLVYALPLESIKKVQKEFPVEGFRNLVYTTPRTEKTKWQVEEGKIDSFELECEDNSLINNVKCRIRAELFDPVIKKNVEVHLVPMGQTILRKVTFRVQQ